MRLPDEDTWEAETWDDFLHEFGPDAYVQLRYEQAIDFDRERQWTSS